MTPIRLNIVFSIFALSLFMAESVSGQEDSRSGAIDSVSQKFDSLENIIETQNHLIYKNQKMNRKLNSKHDSILSAFRSYINFRDSLVAVFKDYKGQTKSELSSLRSAGKKARKEQKQDLNQRFAYFGFATLSGGVLLLGLIAFLFWRERKQKNELRKELCDQIHSLEENQKGLDEKLLTLLEKGSEKGEEKGHSFILKIIDETVRIERNLERVEDSKRVKAMNKAIERIRSNLSSHGYEIIPLENEVYHDGLNLEVLNYLTDSSMNSSESIISRVVRPEVRFEGKIIQQAQVDVSIPE